MRIKIFALFLLILILSNCKDDEMPSGVLNESGRYSSCNNMLSHCTSQVGNGAYCLFGYKWGADNDFSPNGFSAQGPEKTGGAITYSFQEENGTVSTHAQIVLPSLSFETLPTCAKAEIKKALDEWSQAANIDFVEMPENSPSDIRFYIADIRQSGVGYPNFPETLCSNIAGNIVIKANVRFTECDTFYLFVLHEIGHALGLGHVSTANVMNPDFEDYNFTGLQEGDKRGILEIYGPR